MFYLKLSSTNSFNWRRRESEPCFRFDRGSAQPTSGC
jgi:hypothetical protein